MNHSRLRANGHHSQGFKQIRWSLVFVLLTAVTGFCPPSQGQSTASSPAAPASCPVQLLDLDPSAVNVKIRNVSGKPIVGWCLMPRWRTRRSIGNGALGL